MNQLSLFDEDGNVPEFIPKHRGVVKGRFDIDGNIVEWQAYRMSAMTFLSLWGDSISETGFKSHIAEYDLDSALRNNEHHKDIYQVVHMYYDPKCYKKEKEAKRKMEEKFNKIKTKSK
jgi:hypothetical protein